MESGRDPSETGAVSSHRGAIVVLPTVAAGQQGPVAAWVSAAGWATALRNLLGQVWVVTPDGPMEPDELRRQGAPPRRSHRRRGRAGTVGCRWSRTPHAKIYANGDGHGHFRSTLRVRGATTTSLASGNATNCFTAPVHAWLGRSVCRRSCLCPHRWSGRHVSGVCGVPAGAAGPNGPVNGSRYGARMLSPAVRRQLPNRFDASVSTTVAS